MTQISEQEYIKPFQYDPLKRAWDHFNEDLYLKILEAKAKVKCTECNGTGHYFSHEWIFENDYYGAKAFTCLACKGTGKVTT